MFGFLLQFINSALRPLSDPQALQARAMEYGRVATLRWFFLSGRVHKATYIANGWLYANHD